MFELFETNSYRILGLDATASQKDIAKRGKEINFFQKFNHFFFYYQSIRIVWNKYVAQPVNFFFV
jgi:hypothetical protein